MFAGLKNLKFEYKALHTWIGYYWKLNTNRVLFYEYLLYASEVLISTKLEIRAHSSYFTAV